MGFSLKVSGGPGEFKLKHEIVTSLKLVSDTPDDSNARSNDLAIGLQVKGRIISNDTEGDPTLQLAKWALIPVEDSASYAQVNIEYEHAGITVRSITMNNAFIVSYVEYFGDKNGEGTFDLMLRQKKNRNNEYQCTGNFAKGE